MYMTCNKVLEIKCKNFIHFQIFTWITISFFDCFICYVKKFNDEIIIRGQNIPYIKFLISIFQFIFLF